jgi:hypothetical protein
MSEEQRSFDVQGSAPQPYQVTFIFAGGRLAALCDCPAGQNGQYCKHRFRILAGSSEGIVSPNSNDVAVIQSWFKGTELEQAVQAIEELEREEVALKRRMVAAKKVVARVMLKE